MKTVVWRRLDEPGMEIVHAESFERASGTQIGRSHELRWSLRGPSIDLEIVDGSRTTIELGDCDFFDVYASPFFNSLPVLRDDLLAGGGPRSYVMRFIRVPELMAARSRQTYEPIARRRIRYSSGSFTAEIAFDDDGYVSRYGEVFERVT